MIYEDGGNPTVLGPHGGSVSNFQCHALMEKSFSNDQNEGSINQSSDWQTVNMKLTFIYFKFLYIMF